MRASKRKTPKKLTIAQRPTSRTYGKSPRRRPINSRLRRRLRWLLIERHRVPWAWIFVALGAATFIVLLIGYIVQEASAATVSTPRPASTMPISYYGTS